MGRSSHDGDTIVIRWGSPSWSPVPDALVEQFRLANDLRNQLVSVERRYDQVREALWRTIPDVAKAQAVVDVAREALNDAIDAVKVSRIEARTTRPDATDSKALAAARQNIAEAKTARDQAREQHRNEHAELLDPWTAAYRWATDRGAGNTTLYAEYVQERGLGWGTYNAVMDRHRISTSRIISARAAGRPAEHRFHRFDGSGTVHVQVQRDKAGERRKGIWELDGPRPKSEWLGRPARYDTTTARGGRKAATLRLSVRARHRLGPLTIELPVIVHRPLPDGADVSDVQVTCRMIAGRPRLSVQLTCLIPQPETVTAGTVVAVSMHWDHRGDGWLRAARIATSGQPLPPVPADIAPLVKLSDDGCAADLHYHPEWRRLLDRDAGIRSIRDRNIDDLRDHITSSPVDRWRSPQRFIQLGRDIEEWRQRDRHLWCFEAHERDQVLARRRDAWRKVAAWLCTDARTVIVEDLDHAEMRRTAPIGTEDTEQSRHGRAQAVQVAPYELRQAIENAGRRRGVQIVTARHERTAA